MIMAASSNNTVAAAEVEAIPVMLDSFLWSGSVTILWSGSVTILTAA